MNEPSKSSSSKFMSIMKKRCKWGKYTLHYWELNILGLQARINDFNTFATSMGRNNDDFPATVSYVF